MRQFQKNVLRLSIKNKGSFLGTVFIMAIGIFIFVSMFDTLDNLKGQVDRYYEENRLADVFATVSGIREDERKRLEELPGIREVSGKMAADIRLLGPGQEEIVTVHLLSYDGEDSVNRLTLENADGSADGLFLGSRMAAVYGYEAGETLWLLVDGQAVEFTYAGSCYAPDYIYSIPPGGAMVPDGAVYDIASLPVKQMEDLLGQSGIYNELGILLEDGYEFSDVRSTLIGELRESGLLSLTERKNQTSCDMVAGEMDELSAMGTILPALFLAVSVFMLYVVLKKRVDQDQSLIGTMKAMGMRDGELIGAYLFEGAAAGVLGAVIGGILAAPFGRYMFKMYIDFFNLPDTVYHDCAESRILGLILAAVTGILAVFFGVRDILRITPAQAMRARQPKTAAFRLPAWLSACLSPIYRMGLRSMARSPLRVLLIVLAVAFPFSMSSVLFCFPAAVDRLFMDQFDELQTYDLQASLASMETPWRLQNTAAEIPGVLKTEAVLSAAAELKSENRTEFSMLYGLNRGSSLWKIRSIDGRFYDPPDQGVILNSRIASKLHIKAGDFISVSLAGSGKEASKLPVLAVIEESVGGGCYMSLAAAERFLGAGANTALFETAAGEKESVKQALYGAGRVTWLSDAGKTLKSYTALMGSMSIMIDLFAAVTVAAGGILIYNISMINIREREQEFGTLLVLGQTEREMGRLLLFEQSVCFVLGLLLGIPGSLGIKYLLESVVQSDSYTYRMDLQAAGYGKALFICLAIALVSWAAEVRFLGRIRLTDTLKERE